MAPGRDRPGETDDSEVSAAHPSTTPLPNRTSAQPPRCTANRRGCTDTSQASKTSAA